MSIDDFKKMTPYEQELILLLGRVAKALESLAKEIDE
jgi:hypothetical protein